MLRRHGVSGGVGRIVEYYGPGLESLWAMDRHVIANMGAELGATTTVFPSDEKLRRFLKAQGREDDWRELVPDPDAEYDEHDEINLSNLEPLIALPSSPGNVVPVSEVAGREIYQAMIGSSANPGMRDFGVPALMVDGRQTHDRVSFDINPTSRQILENLANLGLLARLIQAGGRIHQAGCNGCIGMGQAPATGKISLRTVPRNFPGRSGTREDQVYLCSPETAAASALTGVITDPRTLDMDYPRFEEPDELSINTKMLVAPPPDGREEKLEKGPNIHSLPELKPLPESIVSPVLLKVGDDISTDEIMPAGARVLPFRSNIPEISKFVFSQVDDTYYERAIQYQEAGSIIVGGRNYGQGSSREHAALAPRYLGVQAVVAKSFARIHWQNLVNFGILPLILINPDDYDKVDTMNVLKIADLAKAISESDRVIINNETKNESYEAEHRLTDRQRRIILAGGLINMPRGAEKTG
jgi:aconitate hydratase